MEQLLDMEKIPVAANTNDDEPTLKTSENRQISCLCEPLPNGQYGRNLVVTIDGTANQFGLKNTNIVELYSRLVKDDTQLTYYNSGIGTYVPDSSSLSSFTQYLSHQWDKAFATNFKSKVLDAYEWLSENYRQGDRIFLFGFSRGAYQVRVIAGMIEKVGLLHKGNTQQIPFAYDLYTATLNRGNRNAQEQETGAAASSSKHGSETPVQSAPKNNPASRANRSNDLKTSLSRRSSGALASNNMQQSLPIWPDSLDPKVTANSPRKKTKNVSKETPEDLCKQFKKSLSNSDVTVHFVGSWDTVSSVGVLRRQCLPETTTGMTHVCAFRHALALDERRVKFLPEYANGGAGSPSKDSHDEPLSTVKGSRSSNFSNGLADERASTVSATLHAGQSKPTKRRGGNVKEVWFAGSHSDVGGGNVKNLENDQFGPSLRWMTYEALIWGLRMMPFNQTWAPLMPKSSMSLVWNILENLPVSRLSYTSSNGTTRIPHRKKPRKILDGQLIHESVFELMTPNPQGQAKKKAYSPTARLPDGKKWDSKQLLSQKKLIEMDPYIQPDRLLDAIKASVEHNEQNSDYEQLFKVSLTAIGLRSICERPGAEDVLASALESESRNQWPGKINHITIIAKILDKCFDLIPVDFRDELIANAHPSAWEILDRLYPEASPVRCKFLYRFADQNARTTLLKEEIDLHRLALEGRPLPPERLRIDTVKNLAIALLNSLILTASQDAELSYRKSLRTAYKEVLHFFELSPSKRLMVIKSLASKIDENFEAGHESYLAERIVLFQTVYDLTPPENTNQGDYLLHLLPLLYQRFEETSNKEDINEIIPYNTEILSLLSSSTPYPAASTLAVTLALSYLARAQLKRRLYHIEEAIMLLQESILNSPLTNHDRVSLFDILGDSFRLRFKETGHLPYLEQAERSYRRAVDIRRSLDPEGVYPLSGLAAVLCDRFKLSRQQGFLDEAISLHRDSFLLFSSLPRERDVPALLLADALLCRFEESGHQADLNEAISLHEEALELNPVPRFPRAKCLNGLGVALRKRFDNGGRKVDLDKAVSLHQEALELCPQPYLERDSSLSGLAAAITRRFAISGVQSDLDEAITMYREALELLPSTHPRRADSLLGLANAFQSLFKVTDQQDKLEKVMSVRKEELELRPSGRPNSLSGMVAAALFSLYISPPPEPEDVDEVTPVPNRYAGLDEAISLLKQSLELRPSPNSARVESLNSLVDALMTRYGDDHHELHFYRNELVVLQSPKPSVTSTMASVSPSKSV